MQCSLQYKWHGFLINQVTTLALFSISDAKTASSKSGSRTAATSKMEFFVIIVNDYQPLTIITKCSILDVAAFLDPPLSSRIRLYQPYLSYKLHVLRIPMVFYRYVNQKEVRGIKI